MKKILGVSKGNFWIYIVGLVVSFLFIGLYFINPENTFLTVLMSVGASLIGAIILAYFVDYFNCKNQDEKTAKIRYGKLEVIGVSAIALLVSLVSYYFKKRFAFYSLKDADKCHKITLRELWDELEIIEEKCEERFRKNEFSVEEQNEISQMIKSIEIKVKHFSAMIKDQETELKMFEAVGYFSNYDILHLMAAQSFCENVGHFVDVLEIDSIKSIFEQITAISEFKHIESIVLYYKEKSVTYETSKYKRRYRKNISEEDIANAIDSNQRRTDE